MDQKLQKRPHGKISLILGPRQSGARDTLFDLCRLQSSDSMRCYRLVVHTLSEEIPAYLSAPLFSRRVRADYRVDRLEEVMKELQEEPLHVHIFIADGHMFDDLDIVAEKLANAGKIVNISGIKSTHLREGFPCIQALIPKAEKIEIHTAPCYVCQWPASFVHRSVDRNVYGWKGADYVSFKPVCRECYLDKRPILAPGRPPATDGGKPAIADLSTRYGKVQVSKKQGRARAELEAAESLEAGNPSFPPPPYHDPTGPTSASPATQEQSENEATSQPPTSIQPPSHPLHPRVAQLRQAIKFYIYE